MKMTCREAYCTFVSGKDLFHLSVPREREEMTDRVLQEMFVQGFFCAGPFDALLVVYYLK